MKIFIIHQHDPAIHHVGGTGTFINSFIKYAPPDFEVSLIGVSTDPHARPLRVWQERKIEGKPFHFFPIVESHPTYHRAFPLSVPFTWNLRQYRKHLNLEGAILELHRIETGLALRALPNPKVLFFHTHTKDLYNPNSESHWSRVPALYFQLEKSLLKDISRFYSVREDTIQWYRERYPDLDRPFVFLPTWVDEEIFVSLPEEQRLELRYQLAPAFGIKPERRILLFVGRFELQKDPFLLLKSFQLLTRRMPETELVMIGGGSLEPLIRTFIEREGLSEKIHLVPPQCQSRIAEWMNVADCFCLTSAFEGKPRVVLEAFSCGLPVVSVNEVEERRLTQSSGIGRLVSERSPEALNAAFEETLGELPNRAACQREADPFRARAVLGRLYSDYRDMEALAYGDHASRAFQYNHR